MKGNLTHKIVTQLSPEDAATLAALATQSECTLPQLVRYVLRRFIHEKAKEAPEAIGG